MGYELIHGEPSNLDDIVAPNTVKHMLQRHGVDPVPERQKQTSWKKFLKAQWEAVAAISGI